MGAELTSMARLTLSEQFLGYSAMIWQMLYSAERRTQVEKEFGGRKVGCLWEDCHDDYYSSFFSRRTYHVTVSYATIRYVCEPGERAAL